MRSVTEASTRRKWVAIAMRSAGRKWAALRSNRRLWRLKVGFEPAQRSLRSRAYIACAMRMTGLSTPSAAARAIRGGTRSAAQGCAETGCAVRGRAAWVAGACALALGVFVYLVDRGAGSASLLPAGAWSGAALRRGRFVATELRPSVRLRALLRCFAAGERNAWPACLRRVVGGERRLRVRAVASSGGGNLGGARRRLRQVLAGTRARGLLRARHLRPRRSARRHRRRARGGVLDPSSRRTEGRCPA